MALAVHGRRTEQGKWQSFGQSKRCRWLGSPADVAPDLSNRWNHNIKQAPRSCKAILADIRRCAVRKLSSPVLKAAADGGSTKEENVIEEPEDEECAVLANLVALRHTADGTRQVQRMTCSSQVDHCGLGNYQVERLSCRIAEWLADWRWSDGREGLRIQASSRGQQPKRVAVRPRYVFLYLWREPSAEKTGALCEKRSRL